VAVEGGGPTILIPTAVLAISIHLSASHSLPMITLDVLFKPPHLCSVWLLSSSSVVPRVCPADRDGSTDTFL